MTLPRTVAEVLEDHVTFELECIDRMYLNLYVPKLMFPGGGGGFLQEASGDAVRVLGGHAAHHPGVRGFDPPVRG